MFVLMALLRCKIILINGKICPEFRKKIPEFRTRISNTMFLKTFLPSTQFGFRENYRKKTFSLTVSRFQITVNADPNNNLFSKHLETAQNAYYLQKGSQEPLILDSGEKE